MATRQRFIHSVLFRVSLGLAYLLAVNLLSGYLAVTFGYPSLWGNSTGIFAEYAYPVNFTWAFWHWFSMLPAMLLVMGLPVWDKALLIRARWVAIAILLICVVIEMSERLGRFQQIPFVLFFMVDAGLFLFLALCFRSPLKWIVGFFALAGILALAWFLIPATWTTVSQLSRPQAGSSGLIAEVDLVVDWQGNTATYYMVLKDTVQPNGSPSAVEICKAAREQIQWAMINDPPPEELSEPVIMFMAKAWFDESGRVLFPAGSATYLSSHDEWNCEYEMPVPNDSFKTPSSDQRSTP